LTGGQADQPKREMAFSGHRPPPLRKARPRRSHTLVKSRKTSYAILVKGITGNGCLGNSIGDDSASIVCGSNCRATSPPEWLEAAYCPPKTEVRIAVGGIAWRNKATTMGALLPTPEPSAQQTPLRPKHVPTILATDTSFHIPTKLPNRTSKRIDGDCREKTSFELAPRSHPSSFNLGRY
jgi:hypothetical protein